jgi:hypothetical protein
LAGNNEQSIISPRDNYFRRHFLRGQKGFSYIRQGTKDSFLCGIYQTMGQRVVFFRALEGKKLIPNAITIRSYNSNVSLPRTAYSDIRKRLGKSKRGI